MLFERRSMLLSTAAMMLAGCSRCAPGQSATTNQKKAAAKAGTAGKIPTGKIMVDLDGWRAFKAAHVAADGRIIDTGNGGISHSEGQGYGLLIAQAAGDRTTFDTIYAWTETTLARADDALFSWRYAPAEPVPVSDPNNATDGDILIAWALMRAGNRWKDKHLIERSAEIRAAIAEKCVHRQGNRTLLLPGIMGYDHPDRTTVNLAYYIWPALDQFRQAGQSTVWTALIRDGETLLDDARIGTLALPTDWTDISATGQVTAAADKPPRFGFDAVRIPLYLMLGGRSAKAASIARYWQSWFDKGQPIPAWVDVQSGQTAPYPLSAGGYAIAARLLKRKVPAIQMPPQDYYSRILGLLASLQISAA